MSFLRALRAYVGLGPDEEIEDRYLYELNSRRRVLDLDEIEHEEDGFEQEYADADLDELDLRRLRVNPRSEPEIDLRDYETDDTVQVRPQTRRSSSNRGERRPRTDAGRRGPSRGARSVTGRSEGVFDEDEFPTDEFGDDTVEARSTGSVKRIDNRQDDVDDLMDFEGDLDGVEDGDDGLDRVTAEFLAKKSPFETVDEPPDDTTRKLADAGFGDSGFDEGDLDEAGFEVQEVDRAEAKGANPGAVSDSGGPKKNTRTVERDADEVNKVRRGGSARPSSKRSGSTGDDKRRDREEKSSDDGVVRSLDSMRAKPRTLLPESFADAKLVADEFKRDVPVLLNLQGLDRDLARRLIDFASGICYALDGSMEKIASQVFLLIPDGGQVSDEDRRRIEERGYAR
jgi:FtsZ-interacting cell division protein YlmF